MSDANYKALKTSLDGIRTMSEWQPIETAPKDGRRFLAFTADFQYGRRFNERVQEARWSGKTPDDLIGHFASDNGQIITHWMPLPHPPTGAKP
jgi:hypothetical protein